MDPNALNQTSNFVALDYKWTSLLLSATIGFLTIYIAWQQHNINKLKIRSDLFDRRFKIYQELMKFLARIMQNGTTSNDDLIQLLRNTAESEFLFGHKVAEFIDSLYKRGNELNTVTKRLNATGYPPAEREKLVRIEAEHLDWFKKQFDTAKEIFKEHLDISR